MKIRGVTNEEKEEFTKNIYRLQNSELGMVIAMIYEKSKESLQKVSIFIYLDKFK